MICYWEGKLIKLPPFILYIIQLYVIQSIKNFFVLSNNNECRLMPLSQRYRAAHKCSGRQTNDTGRHTKGIKGNRRELNVVHVAATIYKRFSHRKGVM